MKIIGAVWIVSMFFQSLEAGTCQIYSDPHTTTFDGQQHHYQGQGHTWYYVKDCQNNQQASNQGTPFAIGGNHELCNGQASCLRYIEVYMYDVSGLNIVTTVRLEGDWVADTVKTYKNGVEIIGGIINQEPIDNDWAHGSYNVQQTGSTANPQLTLQANWGQTTAQGNELTIVFTPNPSAPWNDVDIILDDAYQGPNENAQICGMCGFWDGLPDNDIHVPEEEVRRRNLLTTTYIHLDNAGINNFWEILSGTGDAWETTMLFGDAWVVGNEINSNLSSIFLPTQECIEASDEFCSMAWDNEDTCNERCELDETFLTFDDWHQACIFDACAAADADGMKLEDLTFDEVSMLGFLDGNIDDCGILCDSVGLCPSECDELPCDCRNDDHCGVCQPDSTHHCSQCDYGYFRKTDRNHDCYPCQAYAGDGCMFCQDFHGCGQCEQGYTRTLDEDCGLYYCQ